MTPIPTPLRNMGIFAHIDAGKTSLTERILFLSGRIRSAGEVDFGTTSTDYLRVERERGITVKAACVRLSWRETAINLIDTPGHVDFGSEVERSMRVLDGAVLALCAVAGVQSRTETIIKNCAKARLPLVCFVNKMDRRGASFESAFAEFASICPGAVRVQLPWGEGPDFRGLVDLVTMRLWDFSSEPSREGPLPPELEEAAREARSRLVERLADFDEAILGDFAEGREVPEGRLKSALHSACVKGGLVPVLCGSAFSGGAVSLLLDAVSAYLPSPEEAPCPEGLDSESGTSQRRRPSVDEAFSSFVFKTQADEHFGRLSWLRIWSGRLAPGDKVIEAGSRIPLRVQRIFAIQADQLEDRSEAVAGDIVAVAWGASSATPASTGTVKAPGRGLASEDPDSWTQARRSPASTGSSICASSSPILYEAMEFAEPVVSLALEPLARADGEALKRAVALLLEEDPSLQVKEDKDTGRVTLSGQGELHLEVAVERLRSEQGVRVRVGKPQVSCREVMSKAGSADCDFDRDMNGERVRARLSLRISPLPRGEGERVEAAQGLKIPASYMEAMRRGVDAAASAGPKASWPLVDFGATILSFSPPSSRQAELVLEIAASIAAHEAFASAGSLVLEPWMRLEIALPEDCLGAAAASLSSRGGRIEVIEESGSDKLIQAAAPLSALFGFATELRSATAGRASYQARFLHYEAERAKRL